MAIMLAENEPFKFDMDLCAAGSNHDDHEDDEIEYEYDDVYNEANGFEFYWKREICLPCKATKNVL